MKRKDFIKKSLLGGAGLIAGNSILNAKNQNQSKNIDQIGFNHLPNNEIKTMATLRNKIEKKKF